MTCCVRIRSTFNVTNLLLRNQLFKVSIKMFNNNPQESQGWSSPTSLVVYQRKSVDFLKTKVNDVVSYYQEFTGLKDLRDAQYRVLLATEMLKEAQDKRRDARLPLSEAQKKLQDFQPELRNTPRDDDRYMDLIKEEHALLKELKYLQLRLQEAENDERDAFENLSTSLRTSHEAERLQAEKTKYLSIIASIIGTIIGVVGSSINNKYKMAELKALVKDASQTDDYVIQNIFDSVQQLSKNVALKEDVECIYDKISNGFNAHLIQTSGGTNSHDRIPGNDAATLIAVSLIGYILYKWLF